MSKSEETILQDMSPGCKAEKEEIPINLSQELEDINNIHFEKRKCITLKYIIVCWFALSYNKTNLTTKRQNNHPS